MSQMDTANGGSPVEALPAVTAPSCNACHTPHTTGLRVVAGWDPNGNDIDDQFDICTSCHTLLDSPGVLATHYHNDRSSRIITDSHYDDPTTGATTSASENDPATDKTIEGYNVRFASGSPCADCHNPHTGDVTVQIDWSNSAHAGKIAAKKDEAACAASIPWWDATNPTTPAPVDAVCTDLAPAGTRTYVAAFLRTAEGAAVVSAAGVVDDADGAAWTHYNWDRSGRAACQRCHTSTGVSNFLERPGRLRPDRQRLQPSLRLVRQPGRRFAAERDALLLGLPQQRRRWSCCATRVRSPSPTPTAPRRPTPTSAARTSVSPATPAARPATASSSIPMPTAMRSFINSHYLTAGGTVFATTGYEYAGQDYDFGSHQNVGSRRLRRVDVGTSGPCATCHMSGPQPHTWDFLTKDAGGVITSNDSTLCASCHGGADGRRLAWRPKKRLLRPPWPSWIRPCRLTVSTSYPAHPYFYVAEVTDPVNKPAAITNWAGMPPRSTRRPTGTTSWVRPSTTT